MRVLVTGGTGVLGRRLLPRLLAEGHDVRVLTRQESPVLPAGALAVRGDLLTGEGLDEAVAGAQAVIHGATSPFSRTFRTDVDGTSRLLAAAAGAGRPHIVAVSPVGVDRSPLRYHRARLATEGLIAGSGLPWSIQRVTHLDEALVKALGRLAKGPVVVVPRDTSFQPVDGSDVARRLVALVRAGAAGRVPDLGGPEIREATDLARAWVRASRRRAAVVPVRVPGRGPAALRDGVHLAPDRAVGQVTWEQHLGLEPMPAVTGPAAA